MVDALSRMQALLNAMRFVVDGFAIVKTHEDGFDFGNLRKSCLSGPKN